MFDYKLVRVEKILFRLFRKGVFQNKKIYLFGVSENTRQIIEILRTYHIEPINILDNDKIKQNTYCNGIKVIAINEVREITNNQNLYIICSLYWREMVAQLRDKQIKRKNIFMLYKEDSFIECVYHAILGKQIYDRLINQYGNLPIFVCPYTGTGDIYLIGSFWKQYVEKNHIYDYVFMVLSKACEKAAQLFEIKNILVFEKKVECSYLIQYYMLCPQQVNILILNDSWGQVHTNPLEWFRGYKGLGFTQLFRTFVFDLPNTAKPEHPKLKDAKEELTKLFKDKQLQKGNTVVLSPYSNTLADLPKEFWAELTKKFKQAGFSVCTNSNGKTETAVKGTVSVFVPLTIAPQFVEQAGYFVGVRSGFCDIISGAKAKKIILYDAQDRFFNSSAYEYFSLKNMELSEDAIEILFEREDNQLNEKIFNFLK